FLLGIRMLIMENPEDIEVFELPDYNAGPYWWPYFDKWNGSWLSDCDVWDRNAFDRYLQGKVQKIQKEIAFGVGRNRYNNQKFRRAYRDYCGALAREREEAVLKINSDLSAIANRFLDDEYKEIFSLLQQRIQEILAPENIYTLTPAIKQEILKAFADAYRAMNTSLPLGG
ncbi:MAG: hypothetical protein JXA91_04735, partial [Candidatus Thermoplasmatota archaeon]|nr:hypothetical protein [Candidatus Thermoplasmatota archaeon]